MLRRRIRRYYNRGSTVVYPPVDTAFSVLQPTAARPAQFPGRVGARSLQAPRRGNRGLPAALARRLTRRKGPDRAGSSAGRPGRDVSGLAVERARSASATGGRAVLLPGEEDFGMVPVEAQACGRPVVALARGGARRNRRRRRTGCWSEVRAEAFAAAISLVPELKLDEQHFRACRAFLTRAFLIAFSGRGRRRTCQSQLSPAPQSISGGRRDDVAIQPAVRRLLRRHRRAAGYGGVPHCLLVRFESGIANFIAVTQGPAAVRAVPRSAAVARGSRAPRLPDAGPLSAAARSHPG